MLTQKITPNEEEEKLTRNKFDSSFREASLIKKIASKLWSIQILMLTLFILAIIITGVTVWLIGYNFEKFLLLTTIKAFSIRMLESMKYLSNLEVVQ
jgi:hypothetical protein